MYNWATGIIKYVQPNVATSDPAVMLLVQKLRYIVAVTVPLLCKNIFINNDVYTYLHMYVFMILTCSHQHAVTYWQWDADTHKPYYMVMISYCIVCSVHFNSCCTKFQIYATSLLLTLSHVDPSCTITTDQIRQVNTTSISLTFFTQSLYYT